MDVRISSVISVSASIFSLISVSMESSNVPRMCFIGGSISRLVRKETRSLGFAVLFAILEIIRSKS